jgi:hypothetical protein
LLKFCIVTEADAQPQDQVVELVAKLVVKCRTTAVELANFTAWKQRQSHTATGTLVVELYMGALTGSKKNRE